MRTELSKFMEKEIVQSPLSFMLIMFLNEEIICESSYQLVSADP